MMNVLRSLLAALKRDAEDMLYMMLARVVGVGLVLTAIMLCFTWVMWLAGVLHRWLQSR